MSHEKELTKSDANTNTNANASLAEHVSERPAIAPAVDVFESNDEYLLVADLPGIAQDDLEIHLDDGQLTLFARRRTQDDKASFKLDEIRDGDFRRAFVLPEDIDVTKTDAQLANGVLTIHVPKAAAAKPRRIQVRAG